LEEFKTYGITVAIDDFGTGFSSMSYLKKLNFDKLKIDRSFIKDYPKMDNGSIAEVISYLAQKLKVNLIAEGVETVEQLKYLQSIGCMNIQGYYYSKPLSHTDLDIYLKEHLGKKRLYENTLEEY
jgi:EAL domain-containing protein (putative c-di-GMP-specific phosphodiesterase class I)